MPVSKVVYGDDTLIDLTQDTVTADKLAYGVTAHAANGSSITGTAVFGVDGTTLVLPEWGSGLVPTGTEIDKIQCGNTTYDIRDGSAAHQFSGIVTIPSTGWELVGGLYEKTIAVNDILSTDNPIIDYHPPLAGPTAETMDAYSCLSVVETINGGFVLYCLEDDGPPDISFMIQYKVVR